MTNQNADPLFNSLLYWRKFNPVKRIDIDFVKMILPEAGIIRAGLNGRIFSGNVYQNFHWLESPPNYLTICDEKGRDLQVHENWVDWIFLE